VSSLAALSSLCSGPLNLGTSYLKFEKRGGCREVSEVHDVVQG